MNSAPVARAALGLAFILYPLMVYFGLRTFEPRFLAVILALLIAVRFFSGKKPEIALIYWAVAASFAVGFTLLTGSQYGLLFYPVLINATFLCLFSMSLFRPPNVIEKLARLKDPELPESALSYTRKVTIIWCIFFVVNGGIALTTVFLDTYWWLLYNGFIAYLLIGLLIVGEIIIRKKVMGQHRA